MEHGPWSSARLYSFYVHKDDIVVRIELLLHTMRTSIRRVIREVRQRQLPRHLSRGIPLTIMLRLGRIISCIISSHHIHNDQCNFMKICVYLFCVYFCYFQQPLSSQISPGQTRYEHYSMKKSEVWIVSKQDKNSFLVKEKSEETRPVPLPPPQPVQETRYEHYSMKKHEVQQ